MSAPVGRRLACGDGAPPEPDQFRAVYLSGHEPELRYALYTREKPRSGDVVAGQAVIAEHTATTVIHAGDHLVIGDYGELVISIGTRTAE